MNDQTAFLNQEREAVVHQRALKLSKSRETEVEPLRLGERVRALRLSQNLTLEEASKKTGLARSTLSKIENEQISPTFTAVNKLVHGLGIDIPQLFTKSIGKKNAGGRRDITRKGEGRLHPTPTYEHELMATELEGKKMVPYKTTIFARSFDDYQEWVRHEGEEFLYVLSGTVIFYSEFYKPVELNVGDSAYYDAEMGHVLVSASEEDAEILWVTA